MINIKKKTRSQKLITYLEKPDVYDANSQKAEIIRKNMPKKPLKDNKIKTITGSLNELDINFLIMSHDGN